MIKAKLYCEYLEYIGKVKPQWIIQAINSTIINLIKIFILLSDILFNDRRQKTNNKMIPPKKTINPARPLA